MNTAIVKAAIRMIGMDNIKSAIQSLLNTLTDKISEVQLNPGETGAVIILHSTERRNYATICTINDANDRENPDIIRQISTHDINTMIETMLKNL